MKRTELLKILKKGGCKKLREGSRHSIWENKKGKIAAIPRHKEIKNIIAEKIMKDLEVI